MHNRFRYSQKRPPRCFEIISHLCAFCGYQQLGQTRYSPIYRIALDCEIETPLYNYHAMYVMYVCMYPFNGDDIGKNAFNRRNKLVWNTLIL